MKKSDKEPDYLAIASETSFEAGITDEATALHVLERLRWPCGTVCPFCAHPRCYSFDVAGCRLGRHTCAECRRQFTVFTQSGLHRCKWPASDILIFTWFIYREEWSVAQTAEWFNYNYTSAWRLKRRIDLNRSCPLIRRLLRMHEVWPNSEDARFDATVRMESQIAAEGVNGEKGSAEKQ